MSGACCVGDASGGLADDLHQPRHREVKQPIGVEVDLWLQAGFDVVVNGSRGHLPQAQAQYGEVLMPVYVQVSPEILRQRLEKRGRESSTEITARLERAARYSPGDCLTLNNDGSLLQSVEGLISLIRAQQGKSA